MSLEIGAIVEGTVVGITNFGAFVELDEGKTGLIHISEVADSYVQDVHDFVKEKDKVKVKILGINEKGKFDLSMKQAREDFDARPRGRLRKGKDSFAGGQASPGKLSFEEKLAKFMKESEERLLDLKKNTEAKRGRGRAR
ncbi:MAG: S1 RNA-binding domain-containing protein [Armatimonadetes bacterium]|nr:S1 RNA-binding domain-containing protein [Armatimonadota bacterium]